MSKNILIGVGNLLFCDDGVGVLMAKYLQINFSFEPKMEILDGGSLGFNLFEYFVNYENVIIVDTISLNDKAGEIYKIPASELLGQNPYKNTAHEVEVVSMLEAAQLYETKANVTIIAIVPDDISSVKIGVSDVLKGKFDKLVEVVIKEIQELGVEATRSDNVTLKEIERSFAK